MLTSAEGQEGALRHKVQVRAHSLSSVPDADREAGQEQSRERQPVLPGKPVAPSALQELLGTGSGITSLRTSFTSRPACGIAAGAARSWAPQKGKPGTPAPAGAAPAACEGRGCGAGGSAASERNWEQKGGLR